MLDGVWKLLSRFLTIFFRFCYDEMLDMSDFFEQKDSEILCQSEMRQFQEISKLYPRNLLIGEELRKSLECPWLTLIK